ncbi:MAG: DUF4388 domain-containing protein [Thermoanaerobaculia bacterium]
MELFGLLNTFPVPEVLQWAANDRGTGVLVFQRSTVEKRVHLSRGNIVACFSSDPLEYFGRYLLAHRKLSQSELLRAITHCRRQGQRLGHGIVELGLLAESVVQETLSQQISDSICGLFLWPRGVFHFAQEELSPEELLPDPIHVMGIAMEGARWVDEHQRIREVVPHDNVILGLGKAWPGTTLPALARTITEEWIDGMTLEKLYRSVGGVKFRFLEALQVLLQADVLTVRSVGDTPLAVSEEITLRDLLLEQAEKELRRGSSPLSVPLELLGSYYPQLDGRPSGLLPRHPAAHGCATGSTAAPSSRPCSPRTRKTARAARLAAPNPPPPARLPAAPRRPLSGPALQRNGPVAFAVDDAEKAQRLVGRRPELVRGARRDPDAVVGRDLALLAVEDHRAATAQHDDRVGVLVALESRVAARSHLEVSQLEADGFLGLPAPGEHLSRHVAEEAVARLLVLAQLDSTPTEAVVAQDPRPAHAGSSDATRAADAAARSPCW